jgi:hypothetical protein
MGVCCTKLETVEHVDSVEHFKHLVMKDITMFKNHHKHIIEDKVAYFLVKNSFLEFQR